jgi:acyl carrier protein
MRMQMDAAQIGLERTMEILRELLAERFGLELATNGMEHDPLFAVGSGLSSLEGIEFLCEVEKIFGLEIKDLDWWVYETPTLAAVAQHLIDLTNEKRQHAS